MDHLCYLCLVFVMLRHLFIAALWSHAGKGLNRLLLVMFNSDFVTFPCGILGKVWYLIVLILTHKSITNMNESFIVCNDQTVKI